MAGNPAPREYSYILRLWQEQDQTWRASLDDVQTGDRIGFADLETLFHFIQGHTSQINHEEKEET